MRPEVPVSSLPAGGTVFLRYASVRPLRVLAGRLLSCALPLAVSMGTRRHATSSTISARAKNLVALLEWGAHSLHPGAQFAEPSCLLPFVLSLEVVRRPAPDVPLGEAAVTYPRYRHDRWVVSRPGFGTVAGAWRGGAAVELCRRLRAGRSSNETS
jgi:hypothetical protein